MSTTTPGTPGSLPEPADGADFNFCKNPSCANFGLSAHRAWHSAPISKKGGSEEYGLSAKGKNLPTLLCKRCGLRTMQKSNRAIVEEYRRVSAYLQAKVHCCKDPACPNHGRDVSLGRSHYYTRGTTGAGSQRYSCKLCGSSVTVSSNATARQRQTKFNISVLKLLTNGMHLNRVITTEKLKPPTLYRRIDFFAEQARRFSANRERKLVRNIHLASAEECRRREARYKEKGLAIPDWNTPTTKLYLSTDCLDQVTNWRLTSDKRNVQLRLVATAEIGSGYVLAANLAYDPSMDPIEVEKEALACGDYEKKLSMRRFARLWLQNDYTAALTSPVVAGAPVCDAAEAIEVSAGTQLPLTGMQVRIEYAMYAHFMLLRQITEGAAKVRFYLDPDPGMDSACLGVFQQEIMEKNCEVFTVSYEKGCTDPQRLRYVNTTYNELEEFRNTSVAYKDLHRRDLAERLMIARIRAAGAATSEPIAHTLPKKSEPWKEVTWLTDLRDNHYRGDEEHLARLYLKGSLHSVDNFFQRLRRGICLFERPIATPSSNRNMWYGNSPYNPKMLVQMLDIYRAVYNYVEIGGDGKTPAMRLGLARAPLDYEDVIRFI